ncbi:MAG: hypothetical protein ALECFALPRED_003308 [Alectoria fallacina]|uniref:Cleavage and polyadenylation specificity factor subunit 2 n=1 Tax=Alectoria fallacina TaxID=1903189 RepID=A0A8H3ER12_9LECA|nr:MAG: hypothetical protein ALECFALPRED_003308 [Alectoria fallacina]
MFQFTPLLGAQSISPASQSLLELDGGVKILIDVGWDGNFDVAKLKDLERHVSSLSIILLTHATPAHIAAFAHCCKHLPAFTQIPIYATSPVISLGRTLLQDIYSSTPLASTIIPHNSLRDSSFNYSSSSIEILPQILLQPPTPEEIASYFALIHPLKYSQPHQPLPSPFSPPLNDLTITAYNAGHTLGGTIWSIRHGMESIVYAVDWNQARENVLAGAAWLGGSGGGGAEVIAELHKPTAMICSARGAEKNAIAGGRKKRDDLLLDLIRTTLAKGGTVLIPTDTSARVLELAYIIEQAWRKEYSDPATDSPFKKAKLYLASRNVGATMRYARSMLEWMDEGVARELEKEPSNISNRQHKRNTSKQMPNQDPAGQSSGKSTTPFDFKYLKLLEHRKRIEKMMSTKAPRVILASDSSLEWGFSKEILQRIASDPANLIILTQDYGHESGDSELKDGLRRTLLKWYHERRAGVAMDTGQDGQNIESVYAGGRNLHLKDALSVPLEGKELLIYQQYLASQRQSQNFSRLSNGTALEASADAVDETSSTSSSSSEESDPERQGKALNTSAKTARFNRNKTELGKEVIGVNVLLRQPGVYDYDVRGKKGREQMFPFVNKRRRGDDFGDLIRPEDYLRAEERDEIDGQDMRDHGPRKQEGFGQKRKWQDSGLQGDSGRQANGPIKRRQPAMPSGNETLINGTVASIVNDRGAFEEEDSLGESEDEPEELAAGPSKITFMSQSIEISLRIAYVDFAGLHDQRSLSNLIPLIQPKKLILVSGNASETRYLAEDSRQKLKIEAVDDSGKSADFVFTPSNGQTIDASVDTNAWTVKLSEALVRRLHWQNVKGRSVVTLMGHLAATTLDEPVADASTRKKAKLLTDEESKLDGIAAASEKAPELAPTLDVLPASLVAATRSFAQPLHVGDLRLADIRKILQSTGHSAEFRGEGTLLVDGLVVVRKSGSGKVEVEGGGLNLPELRTRTLEGSFYAVKRKIYDGLAVIAGG